MKKKFIQDISANSFQVIINQLAGIVIFYFCSRFLDKQNFGEINWSIAILITAFNILGSGLDQVTIIKVATGHRQESLLKLYLSHVIISGLLFYVVLLISTFFFRDFFRSHNLLIALGISQFFLFLSTPFKQVATGKEEFRILLYMSICSNLIKAVGVPMLVLYNRLSIQAVVILFVAGSTLELFVCIYLSKALLRNAVTLPFNRKNYLELMRESLPQLGSVIFNSAVARFDWILLGLISTAVVLAEYSFAYKVFELATLPLLILGPLLLPRFTRMIHSSSEPDLESDGQGLQVLIRTEMIVSCFIVLLLNILWDPIIDKITAGKYGSANIYNIFILSCCMPFLYLNNFLWSVNFARGLLKEVFIIITITFLVNVAGDVILIPFFQGLGAAIAFFAAIVIQTIIYVKKTKIRHIHKSWYPLVICASDAFVSGWLGKHFFIDPVARTAFSCVVYFLLLLLTRQLRLSDWRILKTALGI